MKLIVTDSYEESSRLLADMFEKVVQGKKDALLGLATGSSPKGLYRHLFSKVNIKEKNIMLIDGTRPAAAECRRYDAFLDNHIIDILVLGIGTNGHIGFNEPSGTFQLKTHCVELETDTIKANARFFDNASKVPRRAVTMGVGAIVKAKKVILIVSGISKATAIKALLDDDRIDPLLPSSILKLCGDASVVIDRELGDLMK